MIDVSSPCPVASAGKIRLLDITGLRERFGSKWERMAQHVQRFFEAAIRRALKPGDTYCHLEELSYLIMFRDLSAAEAEFKCMSISEEVCKRLFGENGQKIGLRNLVAHVGLARMPVGAAQEAELSAFLEREGKETVVTQDTVVPSPAVLHDATERMLRLNLSRGLDLQGRISSHELRFAYRPIWDSTNKVVLTYLCQPKAGPLGSCDEMSGSFCTADSESDQAFLDCRVLRECAERSVRLRMAGLRVILAVPVHFTSISHPRSWQEYAVALRQIPEAIARDFAFVIFGIDDGVPHIRLAQELPKLSKKAHRVFCAVDRWQGVSQRFAGTGTHGVGTALRECDDEMQTISRIKEVARQAQGAGIGSFVLGLRSTSIALFSINSGVRYLEGPIVRPAVDDPRHGFEQGVEDLYKFKLQMG
jgi:hypothetical protein